MVTAELAAAIPALVLMVFVALSALTTVTDQVRCVDAARATARALARGEEQSAAVVVGKRLAPPGASFAVSGSAADVTVVVRGRAAPGLGWLGSRATPMGRAVAAREEATSDGHVR